MTDDWLRRHEADQKVPRLPADDYDFDRAMTELRTAVNEITDGSGLYALGNVVRVLRHRRGLAAQILDKSEPTCLGCGGDKKCTGCDDVRPRAEKIAPGWVFMSPLGRWETVVRTEQENEYAPVRVFTDRTGPDYSWRLHRWTQVDAGEPGFRLNGTPEIRVFEHTYDRTAPMYAVITLDTVYRPDTAPALVEARYVRGEGWAVTDNPAGGAASVDRVDSKAKARTALRTAARAHAKALGIKLTTQPSDRT